MFEYLNEINGKLYKRYLTIETNIKAKSNSFYDSWLELVEGFSKLIAKNEKIQITSTYDTFIGVLREEKYQEMFTKFGLSKKELDGLFTLGKEANNHKHEEENTITLSEINKFLKAANKYIGLYYAKKYNENLPKYDDEYYSSLYGETEKEIKTLKKEKERLEESLLNSLSNKDILESDLKRVKEIASKNKKANESLEEEKERLLLELNELKDIKLTTMDEKVSKILSVLEKQTKAIKKVTEQLDYASSIEFGRPRDFVAGQIGYVPKVTGFEKYKLSKILNNKIDNEFIAFMKENCGKTLKNNSGNLEIKTLELSNHGNIFEFHITGKRSYMSKDYDVVEEHTIKDVLFTLRKEITSGASDSYRLALKLLLKIYGKNPFDPHYSDWDKELIKLIKSKDFNSDNFD